MLMNGIMTPSRTTFFEGLDAIGAAEFYDWLGKKFQVFVCSSKS
jgi:hypothetical protein